MKKRLWNTIIFAGYIPQGALSLAKRAHDS